MKNISLIFQPSLLAALLCAGGVLLSFGAMAQDQLQTCPLCDFAEDGDLEGIKDRCERDDAIGIVNGRDDLGRTALLLATRFKYYEVIELLLNGYRNCGVANPDVGNYNDRTPFMWAAQHGDISMANDLIDAADDQGINIRLHLVKNDGRTAADIALQYGHVDFVVSLIVIGQNRGISQRSLLSSTTPASTTPAPPVAPAISSSTLAIPTIPTSPSGGHLPGISSWGPGLGSENGDIEHPRSYGVDLRRILSYGGYGGIADLFTYGLRTAAARGAPAIDIDLLSDPNSMFRRAGAPHPEVGLNYSSRSSYSGNTALNIATAKNYLNVINDLLFFSNFYDLNLEVNKRNNFGDSALHFATAWNNLDAVGLLMGVDDIDLDAVGYASYTPLHLSNGVEGTAMTRSLLDAGASMDIVSVSRDGREIPNPFLHALFYQEDSDKWNVYLDYMKREPVTEEVEERVGGALASLMGSVFYLHVDRFVGRLRVLVPAMRELGISCASSNLDVEVLGTEYSFIDWSNREIRRSSLYGNVIRNILSDEERGCLGWVDTSGALGSSGVGGVSGASGTSEQIHGRILATYTPFDDSYDFSAEMDGFRSRMLSIEQ